MRVGKSGRVRLRGMRCHSAHQLTDQVMDKSHGTGHHCPTTISTLLSQSTMIQTTHHCIAYFHGVHFYHSYVVYEVYISNIVKIRVAVAKEMRIVTSQTIREVEVARDPH